MAGFGRVNGFPAIALAVRAFVLRHALRGGGVQVSQARDGRSPISRSHLQDREVNLTHSRTGRHCFWSSGYLEPQGRSPLL